MANSYRISGILCECSAVFNFKKTILRNLRFAVTDKARALFCTKSHWHGQ